MSWLNSVIAIFIPYFPKWFARPFAKPYVAGETIDSTLEIVRGLNNNGYSTTLDILGEFVHSKEKATKIKDAYIEVIQKIADKNLDSTISVKLTHLGLEIDMQLGEENILTFVEKPGNPENS